jgi:hypothetical protein
VPHSINKPLAKIANIELGLKNTKEKHGSLFGLSVSYKENVL